MAESLMRRNHGQALPQEFISSTATWSLIKIFPPPTSDDEPHPSLGFYPEEQQRDPMYTYCGSLSHEAAQFIAYAHVKEALEARALLAGKIRAHGDRIMKRWGGRSRDKRRNLLLQVAPALEKEKWIQVRHTYESQKPSRGYRAPSERPNLMLPWLSVETLSENSAILYALLHYRTLYSPQDWSIFDNEQVGWGWMCGWFDVEFSSKAVVLYGARYGELVDWDDEMGLRGDMIGFPRGRLVLEAQAHLMRFLVSVVDKILEGVDCLSLQESSEKWRDRVAMGFRRPGEIETWSPYTHAAFSKPPVFDMEYVLSLSRTQLDALRDHFLDMQCDIDYFGEHIKNMLQISSFQESDPPRLASLVTNFLHDEAYGIVAWSFLVCECLHVRKLKARFGDSTHRGQPTLQEYDCAFEKLRRTLYWQILGQTVQLEALGDASSGVHENGQAPGTSRMLDFRMSKLTHLDPAEPDLQKELFSKNRLRWCLEEISNPPGCVTELDHAVVFSVLEDQLSKDNGKEARRIGKPMMRTLSHLAVSHEISRSLRYHMPGVGNGQTIARLESEAFDLIEVKKLLAIPPIFHEYQAPLSQSAEHLLEHLRGAKPTSGPRNEEWLAQRRACRDASGAFWSVMHDSLQKTFGIYLSETEEISRFTEIFSASTKPEFRKQVEKEEEEIRACCRKDEEMHCRFSQGQAKPEREPEHCLDAASPRRIKVKTRPQNATPQDGEELVGTKPADPASFELDPVSIVVSTRSMAVFNIMFAETPEEACKSVHWDDFVRAMSDAGFAARNNGGSAVRFECIEKLANAENGGAIIFHRPHPDPTIDRIMLRGMAGRMTKWFGWTRERFTLKDKSKTDA